MRRQRERSPRRDFRGRDDNYHRIRQDGRNFKRFPQQRHEVKDRHGEKEILNQLAGETLRKENDHTRRYSRHPKRPFVAHHENERNWRNDRREGGRWQKKKEDKPLLKLDNPDLVPKASRYFLHDNRSDYAPRRRFNGNFDPRRERVHQNGSQRDFHPRPEDPTKNPWTHDKFEELMQEEDR